MIRTRALTESASSPSIVKMGPGERNIASNVRRKSMAIITRNITTNITTARPSQTVGTLNER